MVEPTTPILTITPAIVAGIVIGFYEIILIHRDVTIPTHRFGHGLHALIIAIIASLAVFNVSFVFHLFPALSTVPLIGNIHYFRVAIGLVMMIKIHGVSAALKSAGMATHGLKETWFHSFVVAALVVIAPYIWPAIAPYLPPWAGGVTPPTKK
ncbi:MAG: hypothetical protein QXG86_00520 [Candidatus Woesearchaeota archaeon]